VPHIAFLREPPAKLVVDAFLQGLADYGYVDGQNIVIDYFIAPTVAALPEYAAKAVARNPAVIVTFGDPGPTAAKAATSTIPIVFTGGNPLGFGRIASYQRPGGNLTGNDTGIDDRDAKIYELAKELIPNLTRIAQLRLSSSPGTYLRESEQRRLAEAFGLSLFYIDREEGADWEQVFVDATIGGAQALIAASSAFADSGHFARLALQYRMPLLDGNRVLTDAGGLASYGAHTFERVRRTGYFIDLILKGANPGDIPVERSNFVELVVNLKTARALGLTVPPSILIRATDLIE
jgi:putative ABC transport system substrate-binding protein